MIILKKKIGEVNQEKLEENRKWIKENIFFRLYEYGDHQVDNYYSKDQYYSLSILDSKDIEHEISCYFCSKGTDLTVRDKDEFCRALEYGGKTMFYLKEKRRNINI